MNKLSKIIASVALMFTLFVGPVKALTDTVTISELPEYTRTDNFKLSYSALSNAITSVQFCYKKDSGSYQTFGPVLTTASGQVQVAGTQISEQAKYFFKVVLNGPGCTGGTSDETSIFYDISGPSPVQNYWKERINPETFRLHWKNPGDSDFSRVFIYRSEDPNFDASDSTKIAEVGGASDDEMSYDNFGLDSSKDYYYALRAIDKAGNASSLVSDQVTVYEETVVTQQEGGVVDLPQEEGAGGEVLGEEEGIEDSALTEDGEQEGLLGDIFGDTTDEGSSLLGNVLTGVGAFLVARFVVSFFKKRKREMKRLLDDSE